MAFTPANPIQQDSPAPQDESNNSDTRTLLHPFPGAQAVEEASYAQGGRPRLEWTAAPARSGPADVAGVHTPPPSDSNSNSTRVPHLRPPRSGWAAPAGHSPSPSLSFASDSDSDTPPTTASPHTPGFSRAYHHASRSGASKASFHDSQSLHTSSSHRSLSSSSSLQSFPPADDPFYSPFTPSPQSHPFRSWQQSPVSPTPAPRPWLKSLPYKRVLSQSTRRSLSPSRPPPPPPLPLPLSAEKIRRRCSSMRSFHSSLAHNRQRTHEIFWNIASCIFVLLIFISNLVYFLGHVQSRLSRFTLSRSNAAQMLVEAPERDFLVIYRIIGNDLPPRHSPHQTLTNLKFLLEHEDDFQNLPSLIPPEYSSPKQGAEQRKMGLKVRKYYILNRIANETQVEQVSDLLVGSGVPANRILTIPFEMAEYEKRGLRTTWLQGAETSRKGHESADGGIGMEASEEVVDLISADEKRRWAMNRLRALDSVYHEKNLYAMNNNGGRNFGLAHGRAQRDARWVLALDGNCFLTPAALKDLVGRLAGQEADAVRLRTQPASHVIIPMSRLLDNQEVLANNTAGAAGDRDLRPMSVEEPQIGFRFSSEERYSSQMRYGRRSKIELLWRLGAVQRKTRVARSIPDREAEERELITEASYGSIRRRMDPEQPDFIRAGWVHRLFSGDDRRQEEPTEMAISRRSINRIKGIVWFLEALDQRQLPGPSAAQRRLFNLDLGRLAHLRRSESPEKQRILALAASLLAETDHPPIHAFVFALADQLTRPEHARYRWKALEIIRSSLLSTDRAQLALARPARPSIDPIGYHFPPRPSTPRPARDQPSAVLLPSRLAHPDAIFYLDAVSLLALNHSSSAHPLTPSETDRLLEIFNAQTHHLLHQQPNPSDHALQTDLNLAALASFTQNTRLLNRILTRSHLRTACDARPEQIQLDFSIGLRNLGLAPDLIPCGDITKNNTSILFPTTRLAQFLGLVA